jgi:signal transduction histidine kinase
MATKTIHLCDVGGCEFEPKFGTFLAIEVVKHTTQGSPTTLVSESLDICSEHSPQVISRVRTLIHDLVHPRSSREEHLEGILDVLMDHFRSDEEIDQQALLEYTIAMLEKAP